MVNIRALAREVAETSKTANPEELAEELFRRIVPAEYPEALRQALPAVVHGVVSRRAPISASPRPAARSQKVSAVRSLWAKALRGRFSVGPEQWKFLGECNVTDLDFAARLREDMARSNTTAAAQLRQLAALLVEHGVETVAELPWDVLELDALPPEA